ncbi:MAG: hypothetical protein M1832_001175 [Thelocarpon impressellum]|nr:MAG: hypothetical protein M1832_001175 [Thelocarpon impressellum]
MATATVDISYLSSYLAVPDSTLGALIATPTTDLVNAVLQAVAGKAREHDEAKAEKLRLEVELENAVRSGHSRTQGLKSTVEKSLKEAAELREKLKEEENARSAIEAELHALKSSSATSTSEFQSLRSRISSLESSNRDTVALLESKSTAHDRLSDELSAQHQKTIDLRREMSELEQSLQAANSAATSAKFRESSLQQELQLVQRSNEWFEGELKTKTAELSKHRKEKGARIAELQRQNEDASSTIDSLRRTEAGLRSRLDELGQKADNAFSKVQQLQEDAAKEQESFRKELESAQRLAELFEGSTNTARERLQDVQASLDQHKDEAAEEIGRIRAEADTERSERDAAERRVLELEVQVERLSADVANLQHPVSLPGTPRRGINGISTPGRDSPGPSRIKGGLNFTQMYTEYTSIKAELDDEKRRNQHLSSVVDDMITDLESKQPEIAELRTEHERLEAEVVEMTSLLEEIGRERDKGKKEARKWQGQVEGLQHEGEILRQQLRDLSGQVKVLLSEVHARDAGLGELDPTAQLALEQMARGELDESALEGLTATGQMISQRLTVFRNIQQLQEQNVNLLRVTRELGDKLEGAEVRKQQDQQEQDRIELEALRNKVEKYKDEMQTMVVKSQSYIKERDMFRRMLQHRGQLAPNADLASMFGQSVGASTPTGAPTPGLDQSTSAKDAADLGKVIKEMQQHFDAYREEATTDHRALKEQAERLSREKGELQAEVARTSSQLTLARERLEMLQANYGMLQSENGELQKRSHSLSESAAKQDLRTQQVAEELIEAKALLDSMRNETANLKAEKDLWKRIEKRLGEDNESLTTERSRLNGLITSMQNLQNERELSDSETRRKLQGQVEALESDLQATRRQLSDEVDEAKKTAQRREYEAQQSRKSIDDLRDGLANVREELVAAKTSRDHLQARVDELTIELRSAEERAQALQPRLTPRSNANVASTATTDQAESAAGEDALTREQELAVEVSELRRDLDLTKADLEKVKTQAEHYKAISQSLEEEIQTHDQYREEMDRVIEDKDSKVQDLERRVQDITNEMTDANTELSTLRADQADRARQVDEEKAALEAEITRLKEEGERQVTAAQFHQEYLKAQADIAQQAQQSYENELVKHAEAAKALQKARAEYNELKTQAVGLRTEVEVARTALSQNESSWDEMKERYERELAETRTRGENVEAQNRLLHQQLENVSGQISALQQDRKAFAAVEGEEASDPATAADRSVEELRELVRYIREGKDIVDVQLDLAIRESKRLKQQLDYAQSQLDETRLKLDQERRANAEQSRGSMTHNELVEKINELNLYRESTVTLRNEARQAQAQLAEKSKRVEELIEQIQPLRATIQELENERETHLGEMKLLQEDRDRYQQRNQNILQKYDRVDPAELEGLKQQIATLQAERDELSTEKQSWEPLRAQVEGIPEQIRKAQEEVATQWSESREKMKTQFKERSRTLVQAKNEKTAESEALAKEKAELVLQLASARQELEAAKTEKDQALAAARSPPAAAEGPGAAMQNGVTEASPDHESTATAEAEKQALGDKIKTAESRVLAAEERVQSLQSELAMAQSRTVELEQQVSELRQKLDDANAQLSQLKAAHQTSAEAQTAASSEQLEELQRELAEAQNEVESLKTTAAVNSMSTASGDDDTRTIAEKVEEIRADLEARHSERIKTAEEQYKRKADQMRTQLNKALKDSKEQIRELTQQQLEAEHKQAVEQLTAAHAEELRVLSVRHGEEMERVKKEAAEQVADATPATTSDVKNEEQPAQAEKPVGEWVLTDAQARELVGTNVTMRSILRSNIATQMKKIREENEERVKERLDEEKARAEKEKQQAVAMAEQRQKVKLSMAEGKARSFGAKVEVVQKAATDTPERAVSEVWEIAKAVKPAPTAVPQAAQIQKPETADTIQPGGSPGPGTFGQPTPLQPRQSNASSPASTFSPGQPGINPGSTAQTSALPASPSAIAPSVQQPQVSPASAPPAAPQQQLQQPHVPAAGRQGANSSLPAKPQQNAGTGPGALRSLMGQGQSAIPRGGAAGGRGRGGRGGQAPQAQTQNQAQNVNAAQRGGNAQSNLPRGGGRGRGGQAGRGLQTANLPPAHAQQQNSPGGGRGGLNAGARQFVPGPGGVGGGTNKRQRDEGEGAEGQHQPGGKRARSSAGGPPAGPKQ